MYFCILKCHNFFDSEYMFLHKILADDIMAVVITHEEVNLLVDTENFEQDLVTPALMNLGFQGCECRGWEFHYNRTIEMGIVLSKHRTRPTVYNLTAYTR